MANEKYVKNLERIIKQMIKPLKGLPFKLVVEGLYGCKVIPFGEGQEKDERLLNDLKKVAIKSGKEVNKKGIYRKRPNEVGNDIEKFVKDALNQKGLEASIPETISGKKKSLGYPDIIFVDKDGRPNYLECKTFNIENKFTTQRSFYLSPSEESKVIKDARHLAIAFEIIYDGSEGESNIYRCKSWDIIDLTELEVDVKREFNADNKRLYSKNLILAGGSL